MKNLRFKELFKKIILIPVAWFIGAGAIIAGFQRLASKPLDALFVIFFGIIIFPPANKLIVKSRYAKLIKIVLGLALFGSLMGSVYLDLRPTAEKEMDAKRKSGIQALTVIARLYCQEKAVCAESLEQIFQAGRTAPFHESFNPDDYFYRQIDSGKDCVISTDLSTGEKETTLCIGEDLKYVKYLTNPHAD